VGPASVRVGADAVRLISENPYRLARDIRGIGFRTADQIAAKLGIEKTALIRVRAGISFALAEAMDDGHCGLPYEDLIALTRLEVRAEFVDTALGLESHDDTVVADDVEGRRCVFLSGLSRAEREIAAKLNHPREAAMARDQTDPRTGVFGRNEEAPLDCDLLVVDETSMVDVSLMRALLRALPDDAGLLLVGDVDQLPSVTIHKSQGSEYPAVVIPLTTQHYPMLQRNLVYTGVTRGKRLVVLVGQRKARAIAVKGARVRRRWSKLREWLMCGGIEA
jgi:ATP-dependent exoDNAse (exonuclease V) alpha subunit